MSSFLLIGEDPFSDAPYINNYIEVFENNNISYDLLYWNRNLKDTSSDPANFYSYDVYSNNQYPYWKKIVKINAFANFVKNHLINKRYKCVVVFTIANAVFMESFLGKMYMGKYIFDIRDYSPVCGLKIFRKRIERLVENSLYTVVSSEGFLRWLPKSPTKYLVNHNVRLDFIVRNWDCQAKIPCDTILHILTIGQLRDVAKNSFIMDAFANQPNIQLQFSGLGYALPMLKEHAKQNRIRNVVFTGKYEKSEEFAIISKCDLMNIVLDDGINGTTLMTNRFYNSSCLCKPMIVNKGSFQSEVCKHYDLGVVVDENDDILAAVKKYIFEFDINKYMNGRNRFLNDVKKDLKSFEFSLIDISNKL